VIFEDAHDVPVAGHHPKVVGGRVEERLLPARLREQTEGVLLLRRIERVEAGGDGHAIRVRASAQGSGWEARPPPSECSGMGVCARRRTGSGPEAGSSGPPPAPTP
jgi:hypothetical protein